VAKETILIVEDNPDNMKLFVSVLTMEGYRVLQEPSPRQVPDLVDAERPALVLMDIQLPEMDGVSLMKQVRERMGAGQPVIVALTAHAMRGDDEKYLSAGFDGYISKPISVREFPGQIRAYLDGRK
jgi:two-component system cell cycle response regulator DivK